MTTPTPARRSAGFTLIELLVVIAIIAILTAIIFPVFATVRENARQQSGMSSLHQIQNGLAQFKLDQGVYPPVLFGYVVPGAPMDTALQVAEQQKAAQQYFPGLYPEYVKDPLVFTDPDNTVTSFSSTTGALAVNAVSPVSPATNPPTFTLTSQTTYPYSVPASPNAVSTNFYVADAFDSSPEIMGTNQLSKSAYVVRYQTNWTNIGPAAETQYDNQNANPPYNNYNRQLRWTNPPPDTYVTCTTDHVLNDNRVLVLWQSGSAQSFDAKRFLTINSAAQSDSASAYGANFWQVSPTDLKNPGY